MNKRIAEGIVFVAAVLLMALVILVLKGVFAVKAVEIEEPAKVGTLVIPAIPYKKNPPELKPHIDNERKLALKLERWEKAKSGKGTQAPEAIEEPEPQMTYLGRYKVTGYDICPRCCGRQPWDYDYGKTASGTLATCGITCAAPKDLPFGTRLYIDGIGYRTVEDRGGAVNGQHIDVLCPDHATCYQITGYYDVYIVEEAQNG